jgi:hypothetical protein
MDGLYRKLDVSYAFFKGTSYGGVHASTLVFVDPQSLIMFIGFFGNHIDYLFSFKDTVTILKLCVCNNY